jgi:peptidoglycan/LPS O-acetylase OafA/YrhL
LGQPFLDGAYWTIAYEIIFYGWIFLFMAAGLFERHWRAIVAAWLVMSLLNQSLIHSGVVEKLLITPYSGYFAFGLSLFRLRQAFSWTGVGVLAAAAAWASATPFLTQPDFVVTYGMERSALGLALMGPAAIGAVAAAALLPSLPIRPSLAVALGGLTYPLYLLHQNIGYAAFAHFGTPQNRWLVLVVLLAILMALSLAISRAVEPPARRAITAGALRLRDTLLRRRQQAA